MAELLAVLSFFLPYDIIQNYCLQIFNLLDSKAASKLLLTKDINFLI